MIVVEKLQDGRVLTYSDEHKWIRQIGTGNEYESAIDIVPHEYEETDREIEAEEISDSEALEILTGGAAE